MAASLPDPPPRQRRDYLAGRCQEKLRSCAIAFPAAERGTPVIAETSANGGYEIDDLTPGRYQVEFTAGRGGDRYTAQWYDGARTAAAAAILRVRSGAITLGIEEG
ncbi:MAG TPA: hypothetical protein VN695_06740 [Streptosporangiaceae bacterium]|nr:hypothetical protein [Streptosporangiaceae bacterium]